MATIEVTSKDRERYARARALGEARAQDPSAVVGARYDPEKDLIELEFAGGSSMTILRRIRFRTITYRMPSRRSWKTRKSLSI